MNADQANRLNDETANALRSARYVLSAAAAEEVVRFWCGAPQDRSTDLCAAADVVTYALAAYVSHGSEPVNYVRTQCPITDAEGATFAARKRAWYERVADFLAAWLRGQHNAIPESSDLGPYPRSESKAAKEPGPVVSA